MFRIFRKKNKKTGELQDVQLRPVEQSGIDPLEKRLEDSRRTIGKRLKTLVSGFSDINEDLLDELETTLLTADVGVKASLEGGDHVVGIEGRAVMECHTLAE